MTIVKAVFTKVPVTTVFALSGLGFMASSLIPSQAWAVVVFYMLAVPYYLLALLASAIAIEFQVTSWGRWVAVALVLLADATLVATRWAADRALRANGF